MTSCLYGGDFTSADVLHVVVTVLGLFIVCVLTASVDRAAWDSRSIKVLFFLSIAQALVHLSTALVLNLNCLYPTPIPELLFDALFCLTILSYNMLAHSLLTTLIIRLDVVFSDSAQEVKGTLRQIIRALYITVSISGIAYLSNAALWYFDRYYELNYDVEVVMTVSWTIYWISYFLTSVVAVGVFARNLYLLATLPLPESIDADRSIQLTKQQEKLIAVSSKYISLFSIAAVSTFTSVMVASLYMAARVTGINDIGDTQLSLVIACDVVVNVACLFLQYKFADKMYRRVCCGLDACYNRLMAKRMKEDVNRRHDTLRSITLTAMELAMGAQLARAKVSDVECPTPISEEGTIDGVWEVAMTELALSYPNTLSHPKPLVENEDEIYPDPEVC